MEDPILRSMMATGYPPGYDEPEIIGTDALGNEVFEGDDIYDLNGEIFVAEEISYDAKQILEMFGATRTTAK